MNAPLRLPDIGFRKITLANGLDVIVRRQDRLPIVAVNLWYHVGSKNEERRQRGFAHLFEHLMFEGSEHYPGDFFKPLQRIGAGVNGSTSSDRTNYYEDVPAAHVELAVAMESDRMGHMIPALSDTKLRIQKDVVKNEYRQTYANRPYGQVWSLLAEALFPPDHPYSWLTIGVMEDVEAASRDDVEAFFRRFYVPSNASFCLVGDIEEDHAFALAERYFGGIASGTKALRPWAPTARLAGDVTLRLDDRVELDRVYECWHTVPQFEPDDAPLALLGDVLARGRSSRLYRRLVLEEEIAQSVSAHHWGRELAGLFTMVVTLRPERPLARARELLLEELHNIVATGVTEEELKRVQNGRLASFVYALDNVGGFGGVADRLNAYNVYLSDPGRIVSDVARFQDVRPDNLVRVARDYLAGRPRVTLEVRGRKPAAAVGALDRTVVPQAGQAVAFRAPAPHVITLRNGVPLWVLPRRDLPIVSATAVMMAGAGAHGPDQGGLASLTAAMLDEGTTTRSARELALAAENMGTTLSATCGWDGSYVSVQCLTPHFDASLDLAVDILSQPAFPQEELSRVHAQTLASLLAERDSAESRAYRAFLKAMYGEGHPYRLPIDGAERTVTSLSRDDLVSFHRGFYRPTRAAWVVAGDIDPDDLARRIEERLSAWNGDAASLADVPAALPVAQPRVILVDRPGAPQAVIQVGQTGLARHHEDYVNLIMFNQILGGQFSSRLNEKLREAKGFTYGVRSRFDFRRGAGPFHISASLQSDRLAEALVDLRTEVKDLLGSRPPTQAELDDARRALIEGQARHFETPSALVARYADLFVHQLPLDEHARLAERLATVTTDSLVAAGHQHVHPDAFVVVVVADAAVVAEDLEKLGWAAVERAGEMDE
jgi:predicted Zn-dependent peptidase